MGLKSTILDGLAPIIKLVVKEAFKLVLAKFIEKEPVHGQVLLVSLYPVIDVELEPIFDATANSSDDAVVEGIKEAMEIVAGQQGVVLPNLDDD